jgi:predicted deacylase
VQAGARVGYVMDPFTGDIVSEINAPREGVMLHAGASWPVLPEGVTLAILGDVVAEHR